MKYIALYSRVSTQNQATGLEAQERALEAFCNQNSITNFKKYSDSNISGAKASRPQLDLLMKEVVEGKVSKVIVWAFSRMARSTKHLLDVLEIFKKHNVEFVSLSEQIDTSNALGVAFFTIIGAIATLEKELISERIKLGLRNAKAKGKKVGRPKTRPSQSIISLRNEGYSYRQIGRLLNISHTSISRELKSLKCNQNIIDESLGTDG